MSLPVRESLFRFQNTNTRSEVMSYGKTQLNGEETTSG